MRLSQANTHIKYSAIIHRGKTMTRATLSMNFGNSWANHPCQCKNARIEDKEKAPQLLGEILKKSIVRVVNDFSVNTYYE